MEFALEIGLAVKNLASMAACLSGGKSLPMFGRGNRLRHTKQNGPTSVYLFGPQVGFGPTYRIAPNCHIIPTVSR